MSILIIIGYFLALLIGISLGLLGAGGSILTVPVLTYLFKMPITEAIPASLLIVGSTSFLASINQWKQGNIKIKESIQFLILIGVKLAPLIMPQVRLYIFILLMIIAGFKMLTDKGNQVNIEIKNLKSLLIIIAVLVGILTGLVGIGGGFMIVPALSILLFFPIKNAIASSLLIITVNAFTGLLGYLGQVSFAWDKLILFIILTFLGSLIAIPLSQKVKSASLKKYFAVFLLFVSCFMLWKEIF